MMRSASEGMTLLEVMVSLFLVALAALAVVPMFAYATHNNATGRDQGIMGAIAIERMEDLYSDAFEELVVGGSLTTNTTGYFDVRESGYIVRWTIEDNNVPPGTKIINVRVISPSMQIGPSRTTTVTTLRAL